MNKNIVLDLAMNLNRIGNWITEDYSGKVKRINIFLAQNEIFIDNLDVHTLSAASKKSFTRFLQEYPHLEKEIKNNTKPNLEAAERMMTWGNILTHKASLIK